MYKAFFLKKQLNKIAEDIFPKSYFFSNYNNFHIEAFTTFFIDDSTKYNEWSKEASDEEAERKWK